jgi:hypothetical protein
MPWLYASIEQDDTGGLRIWRLEIVVRELEIVVEFVQQPIPDLCLRELRLKDAVRRCDQVA